MAIGTDRGLTLQLDTKPTLFAINTSNQRFWQSFILHDSIASYSPYCDMVVPDVGGMFSERFFFTEGLLINTRLGMDVPRFGYISHDFSWNEYQMNSDATVEGTHPTGDATFVLESKFSDSDSVKSRSFGKGKISSAVEQAMRSYNLTPLQPISGQQSKGKLIIVPSSNSRICVQPDEKDQEFVQRMAMSAFNSSYENTSYLAFWNLRNEFYFAPIGYLLKQKPVASLVMTQDKDTLENPLAIKNYGLYMGGTSVNKENYNQNLWTVGDDGLLVTKAMSLGDHLFKANPRDKITVPRSRLTDLQTDNWYGVSTKGDAEAVRAYQNYIGLESNFAYRFEVMVPYHPDLVTGRVVELVIGSASEARQVAPEYTGNWLITGSDHHYDVDGYGSTRLNLGRGTLNIRKEHPFANTFV